MNNILNFNKKLVKVPYQATVCMQTLETIHRIQLTKTFPTDRQIEIVPHIYTEKG